MTKITNIAPGPRGVNVEGGGVVYLAPGESRDIDVSAGELKSLSEEWFTVGTLSKADKAAAADAVDQAVETDEATRAKRAAEAQAAADKK